MVAPKTNTHTQRWGSQDEVVRAADGPTIKVPAQQLTPESNPYSGGRRSIEMMGYTGGKYSEMLETI